MSRKQVVFLLFGIFTLGVLGCLYGVFRPYINNSITASVALYYGNPVSINDMRSAYKSNLPHEKLKILIVPGHEPAYGGAEFGSIKERDLVVEIGRDLQGFLQNNKNYQVLITRDTKSWSSLISDYFKNNWDSIALWRQKSKQNIPSPISPSGKVIPQVVHIRDSANVAIRLYGITKFANDNNVDLVIHMHLNDYPNHSEHAPGEYSGLVIYTPSEQYSNSITTKEVAKVMFKRLSMYNPTSNMPQESAGIVDDQKLIAIGTNNTSGAASLLLEYDYIYESQFVNPKVRSLALKDLAYQTYLGLQDFFNEQNNIDATTAYSPSLLYEWNTPITGKDSDPKDIYALQTALIMNGNFPPAGKSKNDCPHSGVYGPCTQSALIAFQNKNGITGKDSVDTETFRLLNSIYWNTQKSGVIFI